MCTVRWRSGPFCKPSEVRGIQVLAGAGWRGSPARSRQEGSSSFPLPWGGGAVQGRVVPRQGALQVCVKHMCFGAERQEKEFNTRMGRKRGSGGRRDELGFESYSPVGCLAVSLKQQIRPRVGLKGKLVLKGGAEEGAGSLPTAPSPGLLQGACGLQKGGGAAQAGGRACPAHPQGVRCTWPQRTEQTGFQAETGVGKSTPLGLLL